MERTKKTWKRNRRKRRRKETGADIGCVSGKYFMYAYDKMEIRRAGLLRWKRNAGREGGGRRVGREANRYVAK